MTDEQTSTDQQPEKIDKGTSESPTKVQDLAKAGRDDFDPSEGQE